MTTRTETLKLIISGDGKLLGTELSNSERKVKGWSNRVSGIFSGVSKKISHSVKRFATNPLTIVGGTAGLMYAGKQLIDYKDALSTVGINAGLSAAEIVKLDKTVTDLAYQTGQSRDDLVKSLSDIYDKTGDADFAVKSLENVGRASTAMSADVMDTGRVLSSLKIGLHATSVEAQQYFDMMARMGNIGSFTFAQQASQAERLFSAGTLAIGLTKKNFAEYNAFMQTVKPIFGSPDEMGSAIQRIMSDLKVKGREIEKKVGFKLFDKNGAIIDFQKTIKAIAKLSVKERSRLFGEYGRAFTAFDFKGGFDESGQYVKSGIEKFDEFIQAGQKAGFIQEAFARKSKEAKFQVNALATAFNDFSNAGLSPILVELTNNLTEMTNDPEKLEKFRNKIHEIGGDLGEAAESVMKMIIALEKLLPLLNITAGLVNFSTTIFKAPFEAGSWLFNKGSAHSAIRKEYNNLPKDVREQISKQYNVPKKLTLSFGGEWDSGKTYNTIGEALKSLHANQLNDKTNTKEASEIYVNIDLNDNGKTIAETKSPNGNVHTTIKNNRGSFR